MFKKTSVIFSLLLGVFLATSVTSYAQDTSTQEKRALIKQLLALMNTKSLQESVMKTSFSEMEEQLVKNLESTFAGNSSLSEPKKAELHNELVSFSKRIAAKFQEKFAQKVNLQELTEEIATPIYDKNFTSDEIKQLLVFYQSGVGKKTVEMLPLITQESLQQTNQKVLPIVMQIMPEIMESEKEVMEKIMQKAGIGEPPPPPPPAPKAKTTKRKN